MFGNRLAYLLTGLASSCALAGCAAVRLALVPTKWTGDPTGSTRTAVVGALGRPTWSVDQQRGGVGRVELYTYPQAPSVGRKVGVVAAVLAFDMVLLGIPELIMFGRYDVPESWRGHLLVAFGPDDRVERFQPISRADSESNTESRYIVAIFRTDVSVSDASAVTGGTVEDSPSEDLTALLDQSLPVALQAESPLLDPIGPMAPVMTTRCVILCADVIRSELGCVMREFCFPSGVVTASDGTVPDFLIVPQAFSVAKVRAAPGGGNFSAAPVVFGAPGNPSLLWVGAPSLGMGTVLRHQLTFAVWDNKLELPVTAAIVTCESKLTDDQSDLGGATNPRCLAKTILGQVDLWQWRAAVSKLQQGSSPVATGATVGRDAPDS